MIITSLARSCFSCVFWHCRDNDGAGINITDVILVIGDLFDIIKATLSFLGSVYGYCGQKIRKR